MEVSPLTWIQLDRIPNEVDLSSEEGMKWWLLCRPKLNGQRMVLDLTPLKDHLRELGDEHGPHELHS